MTQNPLSVEVSAIRNSLGSLGTINEAPALAHAIAVYIRNPLAMHVQDFHVPTAASLDQAKAEAFTFADALAGHLGCQVESQLDRAPAPVPIGELVDAAMSLWETAMDMKDTAPEGMQALWAGQGTSAMRYTVGGLAEACHREWEAAHNAGLFDEPFDWEWCPRWLRERIEWSATGATIKPKEA